jgi:hypothetical protein
MVKVEASQLKLGEHPHPFAVVVVIVVAAVLYPSSPLHSCLAPRMYRHFQPAEWPDLQPPGDIDEDSYIEGKMAHWKWARWESYRQQVCVMFGPGLYAEWCRECALKCHAGGPGSMVFDGTGRRVYVHRAQQSCIVPSWCHAPLWMTCNMQPLLDEFDLLPFRAVCNAFENHSWVAFVLEAEVAGMGIALQSMRCVTELWKAHGWWSPWLDSNKALRFPPRQLCGAQNAAYRMLDTSADDDVATLRRLQDRARRERGESPPVENYVEEWARHWPASSIDIYWNGPLPLSQLVVETGACVRKRDAPVYALAWRWLVQLIFRRWRDHNP